MLCDYCGKEAKFAKGSEVYPHRPDLADKNFFRCAPCDAYVGCHPGTRRPLGRLANAELRRAKMAAHAAFDPKWKGKTMTRSQAYAWLAHQLSIPPNSCHIGMFDVDMCERVVLACKDTA